MLCILERFQQIHVNHEDYWQFRHVAAVVQHKKGRKTRKNRVAVLASCCK